MSSLMPEGNEGPKCLPWRVFGYTASFGAVGFAWYFLWLMRQPLATPL